MNVIYQGIFLPPSAMDTQLIPVDSNIAHPHITTEYFGSRPFYSLDYATIKLLGVTHEVQPWAMITSPDIDVILCRKTSHRMSDMPHITVRASNGARPVDSNRYEASYNDLMKYRVFDRLLESKEQFEAVKRFTKEHPDSRILTYGTIQPIKGRWGLFTEEGVLYSTPVLAC